MERADSTSRDDSNETANTDSQRHDDARSFQDLHIAILRIKAHASFFIKVKDDTTASEVASMIAARENLDMSDLNILHNKIHRIYGGTAEHAKANMSMKELNVMNGDRFIIVANKNLQVVPRSEWVTGKDGHPKVRGGRIVVDPALQEQRLRDLEDAAR